MTPWGGANDSGIVFKIKPDGTGYSKLLDFSAANGYFPFGSLISDGAFLYAMTRDGGANNKGVVFKLGIVTGIAENNEQNDFIVSPNPTSGQFQITSDELRITNVEIYNVLGEKVYSLNHSFTHSLINLSAQPSGVYFLQIKTEQGNMTKKIVINK